MSTALPLPPPTANVKTKTITCARQRTESNAGPSTSSAAPLEVIDEEELLLSLQKLGLEHLREEVLGMFKAAGESVADSEAARNTAYETLKTTYREVYAGIDREIIKGAANVWGWMVKRLCRETRWGIGKGTRAIKGRLYSISVRDWAFDTTDDVEIFDIDGTPTECPVQFLFVGFVIMLCQTNGAKVLRQFERAAANDVPALMENVMSGTPTNTRAVPVIYGHLSPTKAQYTGLAVDGERRDGEHLSSEGSCLRQEEQRKRGCGPMSGWLRQTLIEVCDDALDSVLTSFLYLAEHLFIAAIGSNNPDNGLNWNAIDWASWDSRISPELLRILWDGVLLWFDARIEQGLSPDFSAARDEDFWGQFSPFVCHLVSPSYIHKIMTGQARRAVTEKFPEPMPLAVFGGITPLGIIGSEERERVLPFSDVGPRAPQKNPGPNVQQHRVDRLAQLCLGTQTFLMTVRTDP
ncbi:hypothetical protein DFH09DRAFT_1474712 [Mycena vulgaris]|nr:hypothetical protein DFH09DRAFT_1474712 [Mycena vulgaris]